jgi:hypothetical protein
MASVSGSFSAVGSNITLLQETYRRAASLGEAARAQDFYMNVSGTGNELLVYLVQAATTPALKREVVETVGPYGVRSIQQGRFMNEIEMAITFKEVVSMIAFKALEKWCQNKDYLDVTLTLGSESSGLVVSAQKWLITDCWIELDGAELSVEDAVPLKLSGTLHGSYFPPSKP